ncbi:MAG: arginine deiminase family protein, partial [Thermoplasmata archaeon]|nr:arginine deiminase family protein [Thermoplasmata archaeon]
GSEVLLKVARVEVYRRAGTARLVREPKTRSLREYLAEKHFEVLPLSSLEQMCYATNFLCLKERKVIAIEVDQEVDRVLATLASAARRDPHRYGVLLALVRKERDTLREGGGFFPHTAALRDRSVEVVPLSLREITGGYGGAHCMTCVINRASS